MEKGRVLVTLAAVMLAFQLVFCFFSTIVETKDYKERKVVLDSYSTLEMIENNIDTIEDIDDEYDPSDAKLVVRRVSVVTNFFVCLSILLGVAALICGISFNEAHVVAYIIILIGSILMALIPFILQWSLGEIYNIIDRNVDVLMNFSGWLQVLCCIPIFCIRLSSFTDD